MGLGFSRERKEPEHDGKIHPFRHWNEDKTDDNLESLGLLHKDEDDEA